MAGMDNVGEGRGRCDEKGLGGTYVWMRGREGVVGVGMEWGGGHGVGGEGYGVGGKVQGSMGEGVERWVWGGEVVMEWGRGEGVGTGKYGGGGYGQISLSPRTCYSVVESPASVSAR